MSEEIECKFGYEDCSNINQRCTLCVGKGNHYKPIKRKQIGIKKTHAKESKRMGSKFEMNNHKIMNNLVQDLISTDMTPNSGAGKVKGDQQIRGLIDIMEELKTLDPNRARGHKSFTIKREWLEKLDREAPAEKMDFWYLKFAFCDTDSQHYVVFDATQMNDMVATIINDRKIAKEADAKVDVANKRRILTDAELAKALAEIDYLKSLLKREGIDYEA